MCRALNVTLKVLSVTGQSQGGARGLVKLEELRHRKGWMWPGGLGPVLQDSQAFSGETGQSVKGKDGQGQDPVCQALCTLWAPFRVWLCDR